MPVASMSPNLDGDVVTLAPIRWFLNKYRLFILFGLTGVFLLGLTLVAVAWWVAPVTRVSSIQVTLGFRGAQDGKYPNELPFSAEELIDPAVLRAVFERHQLQQWIVYPAFESSISISQSSEDLKVILREYSARLNDSKLVGPDRQALEEEYRSRLRSASSALFTLAWFDKGRAAGVPAEVKARVLVDIPAVWAERAIREKQMLTFSSRLPGLNPRADEGSQAELETYASIHALARALEEGLVSVEKLPGASQVALADGTTLSDLKLRLRAFQEQTLPLLQEILLTRIDSEREARRLAQALELQLKFRENRAQSSKDHLLALVETYRDFLAGRPGASGITATGEPAIAADAGLDETFLSRLLGLAQSGEDKDYLKEMLVDIEAARLQLANDELSLVELRQNLELIRSLLTCQIAERVPGASLQPPPPQEDRTSPAASASLRDSANQLSLLLDSSRQLVTAISQGYLGRTPELFGMARGFEVLEVRPMGMVGLGSAFLAWGVLGSFVLGAVLLACYRASSLGRRIRRP